MGFARRVVRKTVRKATPRTVRRAVHPVRTLKYAATPRPVRQMSRAVYTITNPLGAAENKLIGAALGGGGRSRRSGSHSSSPGRVVNVAAGQSISGGGVRAVEAVASYDRLARLMAVQRERFAAARVPIIPDPNPVDPSPFRCEEWARRKGEVRFWQRARRKQLRVEVDGHAQARAAEVFAQAQAGQREQQARADAWWMALSQGESIVMTAALNAAFADNPAPVVVIEASGSSAVLELELPGLDVLPEKKAHVTPSGRLSSKAWTKTELNEVYAELVGAHLLATARETWAVAPALTTLRIRGVRNGAETEPEVLFDVDLMSTEGEWGNDSWGEAMLEDSKWGLNRKGRTREVQPWPSEELRPDRPEEDGGAPQLGGPDFWQDHPVLVPRTSK